MKKTLKRLFFIFVGLYFLAGVALFAYQRNLLFVPNTNVPNPVEAGMEGIQVLKIPTKDGLSLLSWYKPAQVGYPTVLYFQGNAGNLQGQRRLTHHIYDSPYGLLKVEYRGYGGNEGEPTESGLYMDGRAGLDFLSNQGVDEGDIILYGRSLGTGVATQLATEIDARGLILQAPFTAIYAVGQERYPFLPVKLLARDNFDNLKKIPMVTEPLLVFWGDADRTVPPHMPAKVFEAANEPKEKLIVPGGGHSNIFDKGGNDAVMEFLNALKK